MVYLLLNVFTKTKAEEAGMVGRRAAAAEGDASVDQATSPTAAAYYFIIIRRIFGRCPFPHITKDIM
jgi:hypothetical protein